MNIAPIVHFGRHILNQIETGITKEWIETNGLGSYAMGTIVGVNSRRQHGLFTVTDPSTFRRTMLVNRVEESLVIRGRRVDLAAQEYPGAVSPAGHLHLEAFSYERFPKWTYSVDDLKIEKSFFMRTGEETAVLIYRHVLGPSVKLMIRPFVSCRDHNVLIREDARFEGAVKIEKNKMRCAVQGIPPFVMTALSQTPPASGAIEIYKDGSWYKNLVYAHDEECGLPFQEDLHVPCEAVAELHPGDQAVIVFSTMDHAHIDLKQWIEQEDFVRKTTLENFRIQGEFAKRLAIAGDQFVVKTKNGTSIVRGYPWQENTVRECLMSLPGLCLAAGRLEEAREVLRSTAKMIYQGLLPRTYFDSDPAGADYSSMDASLWFVWAVQEFWRAAKDEAFLKEMIPHLKKIVRAFSEGIVAPNPKYSCEIRMDEDGLLWNRSARAPLTWMDARMGEWFATPRVGKPVEVQALWYNALEFLSEGLLKIEGGHHGWADLAKKVRQNFNALFWNPQTNYLYDVVDGNAREGSIRPNALYAVSLPYEILETEKFKAVVETAWRTLYTSLGLRTLSPAEPHFHGIHRGDRHSRASAKHNGTVHPFLIGPFITAFFKAFGRDDSSREKAVQFLLPFVAHLADAGLGSVSEIFDGETPHDPRGGVADARAVAEILRVMKEEGLEL